MNPIIPVLKTGRCVGHNRDAGTVVHLMRNGECVGPSFRPALCGARPGRLSAGWNEDSHRAATCPRCLARFDKLRFRLYAVNNRTYHEVQITDPKQPPLTYREAQVMLSKQSVDPRRRFEMREA